MSVVEVKNEIRSVFSHAMGSECPLKYLHRHLNCPAKCVILTHLEVLSRSHALLADSHAILDRRSELINIHSF